MKHLNDNYVLGLLKSSKTSKEIAALLGISKRYANKLRQRLKSEGNNCLTNKNKGKQRKLKTEKETENKIIVLYNSKYSDFNWTHFLEKLNKTEKISISYASLYRILKEANFTSPKAQKKKKKENIHPLRQKRKLWRVVANRCPPIHQWFKGSI